MNINNKQTYCIEQSLHRLILTKESNKQANKKQTTKQNKKGINKAVLMNNNHIMKTCKRNEGKALDLFNFSTMRW